MIETKMTISCDRCGKSKEKKALYVEYGDIRKFLRIEMYTEYDDGVINRSGITSQTKVLCKECAASYEAARKALSQGFMGDES